MNSNYYQDTIQIHTRGRGTYLLDREIERIIQHSGIKTGLCHCFVQHTSASLIICENADPDVRVDLESWMAKNVIDNDPDFRHRDEGPDDMSAHIRSVITSIELTLPVTVGRPGLGIWQGVYLYEHRAHSHYRKIVVTVHGQQEGK